MGRGIDDHSRRLIGVVGPEYFMTCAGVGITVKQEHATLQRASILTSRHDFLPGVAAFLEIDAPQQLEVDHLRHEQIDRLGLDEGNAARDLEPAPFFLAQLGIGPQWLGVGGPGQP